MIARSPVWLAFPVEETESALPESGPTELLGQSWRPDGPELGFQPGFARAGWNAAFLQFAIRLSGAAASNRARRLNEPTWELGDVAEIFVGVRGRSDYLEVHVTPENQRLQLHFPAGGVDAFRSGKAQLADFAFDRPGIESSVRREPDAWSVQVRIARELLAVPALGAGQEFDVAICRYDYGEKAVPVVSSTAALSAPNFHYRPEWQQLRLSP